MPRHRTTVSTEVQTGAFSPPKLRRDIPTTVASTDGGMGGQNSKQKAEVQRKPPAATQNGPAGEDLFLTLANDDGTGAGTGRGGQSERHPFRTGSTSNRGAVPHSVERQASRQEHLRPAVGRAQSSPISAYERAEDVGKSTQTQTRGSLRRDINTTARAPTVGPAALNQTTPTDAVRQSQSTFDGGSGRRLSFGAAQALDRSASRDASALRADADPAESVVSTTAPSTVWDELDELKSRIRKIELSGGKRPLQNGEPPPSAGESADRPRTATTMTTASSASNHLTRAMSYPSSQALNSGGNAKSHALLRSALSKARNIVDAEVYKSLESSAIDALELSSMASALGASEGASTVGSVLNPDDQSSERRMRRKADNLCRSLTELCIALCEGQQASSPILHAKLAAHRGDQGREPSMPSPDAIDYSPLYNMEERRNRALDRNQRGSFRTSERASKDNLGLRQSSSGYTRHQDRDTPSRLLEARDVPSTDNDATPRTLNRSYTSFSHHDVEPNSYDNDADLYAEHDPTVRIPSRAMTTTELDSRPSYKRHGSDTTAGDSSRALRKFSRDYTSRYPLPDPPSLGMGSHSQQPSNPANLNAYSKNQSSTSLAASTRTLRAVDALSTIQGSDETSSVSGRTRAASGGRPNSASKLPPSAAASLTQRIEERRRARERRSDDG